MDLSSLLEILKTNGWFAVILVMILKEVLIMLKGNQRKIVDGVNSLNRKFEKMNLELTEMKIHLKYYQDDRWRLSSIEKRISELDIGIKDTQPRSR